jgi:hypothetical protein
VGFKTWFPLLQNVPGTDKWVPQHQIVHDTDKWVPQEKNVPVTNKWVPQEQKIPSTEEKEDSKIPLIRLAWDWTGAKLLNILDYQMVRVLT